MRYCSQKLSKTKKIFLIKERKKGKFVLRNGADISALENRKKLN